MEKLSMKIMVPMMHWYPYEGPLMPLYGRIFKDLMNNGHKITIITSFPHYRQGSPRRWTEFKGKLFEKSHWEGATVIRTFVLAPVFTKLKFALIFRALNFISFNITCLFAGLVMSGGQDVIFAPSSPPLTNVICAKIISFFKKIPIIYNIQDMYPDMAIKLGIIQKKSIINIMRLIEKIAYRSVNKIVVISTTMKKNLLSFVIIGL